MVIWLCKLSVASWLLLTLFEACQVWHAPKLLSGGGWEGVWVGGREDRGGSLSLGSCVGDVSLKGGLLSLPIFATESVQSHFSSARAVMCVSHGSLVAAWSIQLMV